MEVLILRYSKYQAGEKMIEMISFRGSTNHICFKSNNYIIILIQEFMMATDMTASGSPEEKLRYRKCNLISIDYQKCYIFIQIFL